MKTLTITCIGIAFSVITYGQSIVSGDYSEGLKLAFDNKTNRITGYFESYSGWDEQTNSPRFSCIFYLEGKVTGKTVSIDTYFPTDKSEDLTTGTLEIVDEKNVTIRLTGDHGGCWNVQSFVHEPLTFQLATGGTWMQIRYVEKDKTYFYQDKAEDRKLKSYLLKGDVVYIEKIESDFAYCAYHGKKITKGWLKLQDLSR